MADELASAIQFCTTPKCYLLHYYYIFRKLELAGVDLDNAACSRLGNALYLEIHKGKEATDTS